jgi:alkanesulfonate monooxygenase SsuD/methylene tetrahydromethanopterin reductase-like flavin-dependent oxidoreductase (luciferase family)
VAEPAGQTAAAVGARRAIFVAPFDELADPRVVQALAEDAEARGWDGFFLWDHVAYRAPTRAVLDPWVTLSACATATQRILLGPLVTPLSRRRVQKVARESATLDLLSNGRLVMGVGLGSDRNGELEPWGEVVDPRERARMLDERLARLVELWRGEFEPRPLQRPRVPVWVAGRYPNRRPLRRAVEWDGFFPIDMPGPEALAELGEEIAALREGAAGSFDVVVSNPAGTDPAPWEAAGATWCLTEFGPQPRLAEVRAVIADGPR